MNASNVRGVQGAVPTTEERVRRSLTLRVAFYKDVYDGIEHLIPSIRGNEMHHRRLDKTMYGIAPIDGLVNQPVAS